MRHSNWLIFQLSNNDKCHISSQKFNLCVHGFVKGKLLMIMIDNLTSSTSLTSFSVY